MKQEKRPRESIAGYRLVRKLGAGGMAEVWLGARQTAGGTTKLAAVKLPARELVGDDRYRRLFRREAELGAQLEHGNIVKVLDEGEDDGLSYLVMEYVDGVALSRLQSMFNDVGDELVRVRLGVHIVLHVLKALSFAHRVRSDAGNPLGIVHRDVSPQNVLVSQAGEVKLGDWGVSYLAQAAMTASTRSFIHGKPRYMAPEQLAGETRDPRIDIYSLGAVFQELLDGRPFRADVHENSILVDAISGRRPAMVKTIPPELERVLARMLERDPAKRFPNARAVLDELREWPGTCDMSEELGELCRVLTGVAGPRTRPSVSTTGMVVAAVGPMHEKTPIERSGPSAPPVEPTVRFDTQGGGQADYGLVLDATIGLDAHQQHQQNERTVGLSPMNANDDDDDDSTVALPAMSPEPSVSATIMLPPPAEEPPAERPPAEEPPHRSKRPSWPPVVEPAPAAWGTPPTQWPDPSRDSWTHAMAKPSTLQPPRRATTVVAILLVVLVLGLGVALAAYVYLQRGA